MQKLKLFLVSSLFFTNSLETQASFKGIEIQKDSLSIRISPLFSTIRFTSNSPSSINNPSKYPSKLGISVEMIYNLKHIKQGNISILTGFELNRFKAMSGSTFISSYSPTYLNIGSLFEKKINKTLSVNGGPILGVGLIGVQKFASGNRNKQFAENAFLRTNLSFGIMSKYVFKENVNFFADLRLGLVNIENKSEQKSDGEKTNLHNFRFGVEIPFTFLVQEYTNKVKKSFTTN